VASLGGFGRRVALFYFPILYVRSPAAFLDERTDQRATTLLARNTPGAKKRVVAEIGLVL
jgi:hypothetical protein